MLRALADCGTPAAACMVGGGVEPVDGRAPGGDARGGRPRGGPPGRAPGRRARRRRAPGGCGAASCAASSRAARSAARRRRSWPSGSGRCTPTPPPARPAASRARPSRARLPRPRRGGVHPRAPPPDDRPGRARRAPRDGGRRPRGRGPAARRRARVRQPPRPGRRARPRRSARPSPPARSSPWSATSSAPRPTPRCARRQEATLAEAGVRLAPTNAAAARLPPPSPGEDPPRHLLDQAAGRRRPRPHLAEALADRGHDVELWALSADGAALLPRAARAGAPGAGRPAPRRGRRAAHPALRRRRSPRACAPPGRPTSTTPRTACRRARCWRCAPRAGCPRWCAPSTTSTTSPARCWPSASAPRSRTSTTASASAATGPTCSRATTASSAEVIPNGVDGGALRRLPARPRGGRGGGWAGADRPTVLAVGRHRAAQGQPHPARGVRPRPRAHRARGAAGHRRRRDPLRLRRLPRRLGAGRRRRSGCASTAARRRRRAPTSRCSGPIPDDDMPALFRAADVFAFPSEREGFGLVVLEAQAAGPARGGERPAGAARVPRGRPRLPDGAGGRRRRARRRAGRGDARRGPARAPRRRRARDGGPLHLGARRRRPTRASTSGSPGPVSRRRRARVRGLDGRVEGRPGDDVTGRGHALRADEPPEFGGEDTGPMPTEMLVAALASCFCIAVAWAAGKHRIPLDDLRCTCSPTGPSASRATAATTSGSIRPPRPPSWPPRSTWPSATAGSPTRSRRLRRSATTSASLG